MKKEVTKAAISNIICQNIVKNTLDKHALREGKTRDVNVDDFEWKDCDLSQLDPDFLKFFTLWFESTEADKRKLEKELIEKGQNPRKEIKQWIDPTFFKVLAKIGSAYASMTMMPMGPICDLLVELSEIYSQSIRNFRKDYMDVREPEVDHISGKQDAKEKDISKIPVEQIKTIDIHIPISRYMSLENYGKDHVSNMTSGAKSYIMSLNSFEKVILYTFYWEHMGIKYRGDTNPDNNKILPRKKSFARKWIKNPPFRNFTSIGSAIDSRIHDRAGIMTGGMPKKIKKSMVRLIHELWEAPSFRKVFNEDNNHEYLAKLIGQTLKKLNEELFAKPL